LENQEILLYNRENINIYMKINWKVGLVGSLLGVVVCMDAGMVASAQFLDFNTTPFEQFFFKPEGSTGLEQAEFVIERVVNLIRLVVGLIATMFAIISSLQLAFSQGDSSAMEKAGNTLLYSVIGIIIMAISPDLGKLFAANDGGLLGTRDVVKERLLVFDNGIRVIITFFKYLLTAVAAASLVFSGSQMIAQSNNEDQVGKAKKNFGVTLGALVGLIFADGLIRRVFYRVDTPLSEPRVDLGQGLEELVGFINLVVVFMGPIAMLTLVAGGLMYAASGGNEETQGKARKMIGVSLLGIIMIYGAFALVSTVISGRL
jgi:hypothetical protein